MAKKRKSIPCSIQHWEHLEEDLDAIYCLLEVEDRFCCISNQHAGGKQVNFLLFALKVWPQH